MATIVNNQQYNPWWGGLATALLSPMLGKLGEQLMSNGQRKDEAAAAQSMGQRLTQQQQQAAGGGVSFTPTMANRASAAAEASDIFGTAFPWMKNTPSQSDVWRDLAFPTAGSGGATGTGSGNPVSYTDLIVGADPKLLGRVGVDRYMQIADTMYALYEKRRKQAVVDELLSNNFDVSKMGGDISIFLKMLNMGAMDNTAFGDAVKFQRDMHTHNNPQPVFGTIDQGNQILPYSFTPTPGNPEFNLREAINKGLSPYQQGQLEVERAKVNATREANAATNQRHADNLAMKREENAANKKLLPVTYSDGTRGSFDPSTGEYDQPEKQAIVDLDPLSKRKLDLLTQELKSAYITLEKVTLDSQAQPIRERIEQLNQEKGEILSRAHGGNAAGGAASTDPYVQSLIDIFTKSQSSNSQGKFWGSTDAGSLPPMESAASQAYPSPANTNAGIDPVLYVDPHAYDTSGYKVPSGVGNDDPINWLKPETVKQARAEGASDEEIRSWARKKREKR